MKSSRKAKRWFIQIFIHSTTLTNFSSSILSHNVSSPTHFNPTSNSHGTSNFAFIVDRHEFDPNERDANNPPNPPDFTYLPSSSPSHSPSSIPSITPNYDPIPSSSNVPSITSIESPSNQHSINIEPSKVPSHVSKTSHRPSQLMSYHSTISYSPTILLFPTQELTQSLCQLIDGLYYGRIFSPLLNTMTVTYHYQVEYSTFHKNINSMLTREQLKNNIEEAIGNNLINEIWNKECGYNNRNLNHQELHAEYALGMYSLKHVIGYSNLPYDQIDEVIHCQKEQSYITLNKCMHIKGHLLLFTHFSVTKHLSSTLIPIIQHLIELLIESPSKPLYIHTSIISMTYVDPKSKYLSKSMSDSPKITSKSTSFVFYLLAPALGIVLFVIFLLAYKRIGQKYIKTTKNLEDDVLYETYDMTLVKNTDTTVATSIQEDLSHQNYDIENLDEMITSVDEMSTGEVEASMKKPVIISPTSISGRKIFRRNQFQHWFLSE